MSKRIVTLGGTDRLVELPQTQALEGLRVDGDDVRAEACAYCTRPR